MKHLRKKRGQAVIESVLILTVLFGLTMFILNKMKADAWLNELVGKPARFLQGMARSGNWKAYPTEDMVLHPNHRNQFLLSKGESVQ